jgi:hypothetical protein
LREYLTLKWFVLFCTISEHIRISSMSDTSRDGHIPWCSEIWAEINPTRKSFASLHHSGFWLCWQMKIHRFNIHFYSSALSPSFRRWSILRFQCHPFLSPEHINLWIPPFPATNFRANLQFLCLVLNFFSQVPTWLLIRLTIARDLHPTLREPPID